MDNEKMIGSIRALCKSKNITPTKLEEELGFSQGLIGRWKDKNPNLDRIIDIADYFQVSLDEVVGRKRVVDDDFIAALVEATEKQNIIWHKYNNENDEVRKYKGTFIDVNDFVDFEQYNDYADGHDEISYYASFKNGYISIYSFFRKFEITTPKNILLFIQPNVDSELIPQRYGAKELLPLWLKVIYALGEEQPDEIKAEEFKTQFVLDSLKTNNKNVSSNNTNFSEAQRLLSNPDIIKVMEVYNKPEFQELRKIFSDPEFQTAMQMANRLQQYLEAKD